MNRGGVRLLLIRIAQAVRSFVSRARFAVSGKRPEHINLCCGATRLKGYLGVDVGDNADLCLDLSRHNLPMVDNSVQSLVCMSAINYFTRERAAEIVQDVYRVLCPGGIARFGVQDLEYLARAYVQGDREFFFQTLPDGRERFEGKVIGDKFASWFYGYIANGFPCRYVFDYESLAALFLDAGFTTVERKGYRESRLENIDTIDNRPEQMFFLEAVK